MAEAFIDVNVQLAFRFAGVGKNNTSISLCALFIGFSLATGSLAQLRGRAERRSCFSDSITAGYGLAKECYPGLTKRK